MPVRGLQRYTRTQVPWTRHNTTDSCPRTNPTCPLPLRYSTRPPPPLLTATMSSQQVDTVFCTVPGCSKVWHACMALV